MTKTMPELLTASDRVASCIRRWRRARDWTAAELAAMCAQAGYPWLTASVIANIESGRRGPTGRRRRHVTVDEIEGFAAAFGVTPRHLLLVALATDAELAADSARQLGLSQQRAGQVVFLSPG